MPIYAYKCDSCGHAKDVLQKMSDEPLTQCPACGQAAFKKQLTAAGFQLKGSGWYVTDFREGSKAKDGKDDKKAEDTASTPATAAPAATSADSNASATTSASSTTSTTSTEKASPAPAPVSTGTPAST